MKLLLAVALVALALVAVSAQPCLPTQNGKDKKIKCTECKVFNDAEEGKHCGLANNYGTDTPKGNARCNVYCDPNPNHQEGSGSQTGASSSSATTATVNIGDSEKVLGSMCGYISKFLGTFETTRQLKVKEIADYDAQMNSLNAINKEKFEANKKLLVNMDADVEAKKADIAETKADILSVQDSITRQNNQLAEENAEYIAVNRQIAESNREADSEMVVLEGEMTRQQTEIDTRFPAGIFEKLQAKFDSCELTKEESAKTHAFFHDMTTRTKKIKKTLASQLGEVNTVQKQIKGRAKIIRENIDGVETTRYQQDMKTETTVESKLGMVVTDMEAEVSELALWLQEFEGANLYDDKMTAAARKQHEERVGYVEKQMDADMDFFRSNQRFRGGAKLVKHHHQALKALQKSMKAITAHVKGHVSSMGRAHNKLHTSILCKTREDCKLMGLKTVADFKTDINSVVSTYESFYTNLCGLEKEFQKKKDAQAVITKKTWDDYYKQKDAHAGLKEILDKFEKDVTKVHALYKEATGQFEEIKKLLIGKQEDVAEQKRQLAVTEAKNEKMLVGVRMTIETLVETLRENSEKQALLEAQHEKCLAEDAEYKESVRAMKQAALDAIEFKGKTNHQMEVYRETVSNEKGIYSEAADTLNAMRDHLMTAETKVNVGTLTAENFTPDGSGRIDDY